MEIKVVHLISSLKRGGRERQLAGILSYSQNEIKNIAIVFNESKNDYVEEYDLYTSIRYIESRNSVRRIWEIYKIIKLEKPNVIWSWGGFEAGFAMIVSPVTNTKHINGSVRHGVVLKTFKHQWRKALLHLSKNVVANSKEGLKANGLKKGMVLYNGLDSKFFGVTPDSLISYENGDKKQINFVSVANLVPFKDYFTVLKALKILKEISYKFSYRIVGEGPMRDQIEKSILQFNLQSDVKLLGRRSDVKDILQSSDVFIHSSIAEGCSNAIMEAIASGLPIIATNTGGNSEIVKPSFGFLFEFGNEKQLSIIIKDLLNSEEAIDQLKRNANQYARENFTMKQMMENYTGILHKVIK